MYRGGLHARFTDYWRLELANAVLAPAMALVWFWPLGPVALAALVPMCGLLVIGGLYWRAKLHQLQGQPSTMAGVLAWASRLQLPLAAATAAVSVTVALAWAGTSIGEALLADTGDRVVATIAAVFAVAEYVNYYHRQLQHFDRAADWRRLVTGRGFRPAHLGRDLARWRVARRDP